MPIFRSSKPTLGYIFQKKRKPLYIMMYVQRSLLQYCFSGKKKTPNELEITSIKAYHRIMCTVWSCFYKKRSWVLWKTNTYNVYMIYFIYSFNKYILSSRYVLIRILGAISLYTWNSRGRLVKIHIKMLIASEWQEWQGR